MHSISYESPLALHTLLILRYPNDLVSYDFVSYNILWVCTPKVPLSERNRTKLMIFNKVAINKRLRQDKYV